MKAKKQHGGRRDGAGRPKGQGPYGESTKPIRVPISLLDQVKVVIQEPGLLEKTKGQSLPLYGSKVAAGFPSPAEDHIEESIDLNDHLIKHPTATFLVKATGYSMTGAGIHPDDIMVVDRSLEAINGKIVIAAVNGELTVKRLYKQNGKSMLLPENPNYNPIDINLADDVHIWGVVTNVIHKV